MKCNGRNASFEVWERGAAGVNTISICMIVKNEENVLGRCLDSLKGIGDEIIIVDTGSTDATKQIAAKYTDKIFDYRWCDDFADARNYSFSKATMDFIYSADADEVLDEENRQKFLALKKIRMDHVEIVQMKYANQLSKGTTYNFDKEYRPKLFRRLRKFQWIEPVHEMVRLDPVVYDSDIEIIHMPEQNHSARDFHIFFGMVQRGERLSERLLHMFAKELFFSEDESVFSKAEPLFEKFLKDTTRTQDELNYILAVLSKSYRLSGNMHGLLKVMVKAIAGEPCSEICYELGEYFFQKSEYDEAAIWFYNAAFSTGAFLNVHYQGDYPLRKLVECYESLGIEEEAEKYRVMWKESGRAGADFECF